MARAACARFFLMNRMIHHGAQWKLSDYKGKVVVIDFWGNW